MKEKKKWVVDAGIHGLQETVAVSAKKAVANVVWRLKKSGVLNPITTYWSEPKGID